MNRPLLPANALLSFDPCNSLTWTSEHHQYP
jgi:hypothetical protein